jgi:signal transduction protein with GAF and PtsI domain
MKSLMDLDEYKNEWTRTKKKSEIDKVIARATLLAEILAQEDINGINFDRKNSLQSKAKWQSLTLTERTLVDEAYLRHKKLDPSEIPKGQSATTTIYEDKRWDVALNLLKNI